MPSDEPRFGQRVTPGQISDPPKAARRNFALGCGCLVVVGVIVFAAVVLPLAIWAWRMAVG